MTDMIISKLYVSQQSDFYCVLTVYKRLQINQLIQLNQFILSIFFIKKKNFINCQPIMVVTFEFMDAIADINHPFHQLCKRFVSEPHSFAYCNMKYTIGIRFRTRLDNYHLRHMDYNYYLRRFNPKFEWIWKRPSRSRNCLISISRY